MAARQREISISEFFLKNRHLLGFDSPHKAILTTVKEAVDNALDACEEAGILPEVRVEVSQKDEDVYVVAVEDNGPGIVEKQIARIFGKLLYGSKFHELRQSRGQQGMGISAAGMYGQLTTGKPMRILSRTAGDTRASELVVSIDTSKNRPDIHRRRRVRWSRPHGTRVEVELLGHYSKGPHSVDMYLKQTAIANPHVTLRFVDPHGDKLTFRRNTNVLPPPPKAIRPHPHGVELGRLIQMLHDTPARTLRRFLEDEFSRVGTKTAREIIRRTAGRLTERSNPRRIAHVQAAALHRAIARTPVMQPRSDCIVPIGETRLLEGLRKELDAETFLTLTRTPAVYRGNPFQVEVGVAWSPSGLSLEMDRQGRIRKKRRAKNERRADEPVHVLRFANRVPLLYQQSACAITRAVTQTNWRAYGLKQPVGGLPAAPMAIIVHLASVWVPYTSESKEAIAAYPEILKELKLALQECGRRLAAHIRRNASLVREKAKQDYIEQYLPHVGSALQDILDLNAEERRRTVRQLDNILHRSRKK
jgi:DNA topoisomerase-6 subunit B